MKTIYLLRVNDAKNQSRGGFQYPRKGKVSAPDWTPTAECGGGLHGWENGEGDSSAADIPPDGVWCLLKVVDSPENLVRLDGKVKFKEGTVILSGSREVVTQKLYSLAKPTRMIGLSMECGDKQTLTGGDYSTLTGGYYSTLTGGYRSTLTGGDVSTLTGGNSSTLTVGDWSTLTGGDWSTLTGGDRSTLAGGYGSTLTGGNYSTLTGGNYSTLTGGNYSTLTGGNYSTLTGGNGSTLIWKIWDGSFYRITVAYLGEDGIKPNVPYTIEDGKVVEVRG